MPGDQRPDQLHPFPCRPRPFHHDPGKVGIVRPRLILRRHFDQVLARGRPDIAHRHPAFVQPAIRERRRHAKVIAIAHPHVAQRLGRLRYLRQHPRHIRLRRHPHGDRAARLVRPARVDLEPVARRLVAISGQIGHPVSGEIAPDIDAVAHDSIPAVFGFSEGGRNRRGCARRDGFHARASRPGTCPAHRDSAWRNRSPWAGSEGWAPRP